MKPQLQLIDPSFQSHNSEKCDLLMHIGSAGISYAIINKDENKLNVLSEVSLPNNENGTIIRKLDELIEKNDHLKFPYHQVIVCIETYKYTFIPTDIYDNSNLAEYARFINPERFEEIVVSDIKHPAMKNIFSLDASIQKKVLERFPKAKIIHQADAFLKGTLKTLKNDLPNQLFINIQVCNFEIALYVDNKLQLYNIYDYKTVDEFNYFLLAIIDQFQLKALTTTIILAGKINQGEDLYLRIQKYFTKIKLADSDSFADRNYIFHRVQSHTYFSLLSLTLCE